MFVNLALKAVSHLGFTQKDCKILHAKIDKDRDIIIYIYIYIYIVNSTKENLLLRYCCEVNFLCD